MKKLMLVIIAVCAINAPSAQAAEHPVVSAALDTTVSTVKRIVKFPLALVATVAAHISELASNNPVTEAWGQTK